MCRSASCCTPTRHDTTRHDKSAHCNVRPGFETGQRLGCARLVTPSGRMILALRRCLFGKRQARRGYSEALPWLATAIAGYTSTRQIARSLARCENLSLDGDLRLFAAARISPCEALCSLYEAGLLRALGARIASASSVECISRGALDSSRQVQTLVACLAASPGLCGRSIRGSIGETG